MKSNFFNSLSIKWKIMLISVMTSVLVLTLVGTAIVFDQRTNLRNAMLSDLKALALVVGDNSGSAVVFNDPNSAKQTLSALKTKPSIVMAAIYLKEGKVFVTYQKEGSKVPALPPLPPQDSGYFFQEKFLSVFEPIRVENDVVGTVYILSDLQELSANLRRSITTLMVIFLISIVASLLISSILQRVISSRLIQLVKTTQQVSAGKDYALRVANDHSRDELGLLIDGFNEMLEQIQARDVSLRKAHDELEGKIEERTQQLQGEIAERQEAEEELKKKTDELAHSNKELEQFAYIASHDLQEPLRMIASYVQLLARRYKGKLDKDADDFIQYSVDGAARMQNLITDLLAYSRIGTKGKPLVPVDGNKSLDSALVNLQMAIQDSKAVITRESLPIVMADPVQLTQLFQNLVGNALKYRGERTPAIKVGLAEKDGNWIFSIADNGIGIDPKYFDRIFEIFQRLHTKGEYAGTGIGLSICKKIVERHKGKIWVESQPGEGSEFKFSLPKIKEVFS